MFPSAIMAYFDPLNNTVIVANVFLWQAFMDALPTTNNISYIMRH